jgi:hypothetical protein
MEPLTLPSEPDFDESVALILKDLPPSIQDFLTGPERDRVTLALTEKHQLHADQAGAFQQAFVFMLMGIYTPEQFTHALLDAGVPQTTIDPLIIDLNEQVFKPLSEKVKQPAPVAAPAPRPPLIPAMQLVDQPRAVPPPPVPTPPSATFTAPVSEPQGVRTMADDMQAVKEHRTPEPIETRAPLPLSPTPSTPAPAPTAPAPSRTIPPPANLPGIAPPPLYRVDPYREATE